ncbi:hypothetical protein CAEBREN_31021 [Caenorhabditis brenneri]|uniref:Uncharacterized protein n=1 Tax=Caenorhabditis brenneri TaxID=135651 RepID=G0PBV0_CAEBE|nr:hypothetical protein CAEBREN_31021 [Caenorhabditis brenneri]
MLVVIAFLPVNSALKLTERENEMRRETCGKGLTCGFPNLKIISNNFFSREWIWTKINFPKVCDDKQLDFDDFAILELSEDIEFSKTVQFVCIVFDDSNLFIEDNRMKLFGFGVNRKIGY